MYVEATAQYYVGAEQHTRRAWFLILMQPGEEKTDYRGKSYVAGLPGDWPLRAVLRQVALQQCGQFMMGCARIGGQTVTLSGSYGNDGLPKTVSVALYNMGLELPPALCEAWAKGGGHNSAGAEAPALRKWARDNFAALAPEGAVWEHRRGRE